MAGGKGFEPLFTESESTGNGHGDTTVIHNGGRCKGERKPGSMVLPGNPPVIHGSTSHLLHTMAEGCGLQKPALVPVMPSGRGEGRVEG
jgi:hypothetical protein